MAIMDRQEESSLPTTSSQTQKSTAAAGTDVISELMAQASQADLAARQATAAANVPIAGGHMMPQNVMLPGGGMQHPQLQMDTRDVVGHRQAIQRGIANATRGVANLVSAVSTQVEQKQTQRLAVNMERLMSATQSMDQAQQVLKQSPNDPTATEQAKRASAIMDEILSDDKTRKSIQKAYNINFTDPSKNNTKEHAALKQATESYSQQFQKQLPTQMAPNQAAIEQAKLAQAQAAATHKTIDAIIPAIIRGQSAQAVEQMKGKTAAEIAQFKEQAAWDRLRQHDADTYKTAIDRANIAKDAHLAGVMAAVSAMNMRADNALKQRIKEHGGSLAGMPLKDLENQVKEFDITEKNAKKTISDLAHLRDAAKKDQKKMGITPERLEAYNQSVHAAEENLTTIQERRKMFQDMITQRLEGVQPTQSDENTSDPVVTGAVSQDSGAGQGTADDPEHYDP